MFEVRNLVGDAQPEGQEWVLIEKRGNLFFVTARKEGEAVDASVAPAAFDRAEAAIHAATTWAELP